MKITAADLKELGVIDEIIPEAKVELTVIFQNSQKI